MSLTLIRRVQFWLLMTIVTYLSLVPDPGPVFAGTSDKFLHFVAYFALFFSIDIAYRMNRQHFNKLLFLLLYSVGIEIAQGFTEHRFFSVMDIVANLAGLLAGLLAIRLLHQWWGLLRQA